MEEQTGLLHFLAVFQKTLTATVYHPALCGSALCDISTLTFGH